MGRERCQLPIKSDLRAYDTRHTAIVLDEASASLVLRHKKRLQGRVEEVSMAASGTNTYCIPTASGSMLHDLRAQKPRKRKGSPVGVEGPLERGFWETLVVDSLRLRVLRGNDQDMQPY